MQQENAANLLQTQLIDAINESLQNHVTSNAIFLAERLLAQKDTEQTRNLLAECYMAENKHYKVVYILKDCKTEQNRYKLAVSYVKLGKLKQAEKVLLGSEFSKGQNKLQNVPNGSYGFYLLGTLTQKQHRFGQAKDYFLKALQLNPTLWSAYEKIGRLGQNVAPNIFSDNKMKNYENHKRVYSIANKKKEETDNKIRRGAPSQGTIISKRKNSMQNHQTQFNNLMSLLRRLGDGYHKLCSYNCIDAIQEFKKLPQNQFNTGWVLTNVGRAYMEIVKYNQAINYYQQASRLQPYRLEGVQYYSSCLWHLKKQVQLCYLAHQSLEKSTYSSQAWIVVGNCFSSQKEHQQALKFFQRAISLNPFNPYAYSLCGHEHVYNEDFSKAKKNFESALSLDVRHYSAWWGLGNIAFKQQRYDKAIQNFNKAIGINPKNPVLYSFMGMTLAAKRQYHQALKFFEKSEELDPKNGLNRYQKANTLVKLEKHDIAIQQLQNLQSLMPKQAPIPMLLGKIYKKIGKTQKAHYYFSLALDLESKDAQKIKGFIESLHNASNDGQDMDI